MQQVGTIILQFMKVIRTFLSQKPQPQIAQFWTWSSFAVLCGLSILFWKGPTGFQSAMPLSKELLLSGDFWRPFTALVAHSDFAHLASNSLLFVVFAYLLSGYFGPKVFPLGMILCGALINALSILTYPPKVHLIGASGMVYCMAATWIGLYMVLDRRHGWGRRLMSGLGVSLMLLFPQQFQPQVSYRTHAIGFLVGLFFAGIIYWVDYAKFLKAIRYRVDWDDDIQLEGGSLEEVLVDHGTHSYRFEQSKNTTTH